MVDEVMERVKRHARDANIAAHVLMFCGDAMRTSIFRGVKGGKDDGYL